MTHAVLSAEARAVAGIGDALVRLSLLLEHVEDLVSDFELAFGRVQASAR